MGGFALALVLALALSLGGGASASQARALPSDNRPLRIAAVRQLRKPAAQFRWTEFEVELQATYSSPFGEREIDVRGEFSAPSGKKITLPAFFFQDFRRALVNGRERLEPNGTPTWRLRFCPTEPGRHTLRVFARDSSGKQASAAPLTFNVSPSEEPGFVRVSSADCRYFAFDSGAPYFAIGANVCWGHQRGTFDYDEWLRAYGEAGCNYFRLWLGPAWTTFALERERVGAIDLANAWRLDYVLDLAEKYGLYVMLCLDSFNELRMAKSGGYSFWEQTPHNRANGGPLAQPIEFWTNDTMLRCYRAKLRYLVARYACRTHVLSWEFWNEVDIISPEAWEEELVRRWHEEMARYLRRLDPYDHLITTSFARSPGVPEIDRLPELDYVQTHSYGQRDIATALAEFHKAKEQYGKPHYVGEFGTGAAGGEDKRDPKGICLHNGLWSQLCLGAAGTAMLWWWDNHIHKNNLYYHFAAVSRFVEGIDFPKLGLRRLEGAELSYATPQPARYVDLIFPQGPQLWQPALANRPTEVFVDERGNWRTAGEIAGVLHGLVNHPDLHNPLTFHLRTNRPTRLVVSVEGVSGYGGAHLVCHLDDKLALDRDMPDTDGDKSHATLHQYDGQYAIDIPPGEHTVRVENVGRDWILVGYSLAGGLLQVGPPLRVFGLQNDEFAIVWLQNAQHTWYRMCVVGEQLTPVPPTRLTLHGLRDGAFRVELWDTYAGRVSQTQESTARGGALSIALPEIEKDVALKLVRQQR